MDAEVGFLGRFPVVVFMIVFSWNCYIYVARLLSLRLILYHHSVSR